MLMRGRRWLVEIEDTDESFRCEENEHLLQGMLRMGKKGIPSGCHGGGCGVCKIRILDGEAEFGVMSAEHVNGEERERGYALACRTWPRSDLRIRVVGKMARNVLRPKRKYGFV
ncbi:MAG TPA: 2Fe-2S iron-sulfur cluster binding domain-containing protein [Thermopetrobacter sp.]|nr:2Fe-2S iron-sulfur cluster binding domain-containing protein [Thermopetrobacter sp.]